MVIKWTRVMLEAPDKEGRLREMKSYLITYSQNYKEHLEALSSAIKYISQTDCIRIIIENGEIEK